MPITVLYANLLGIVLLVLTIRVVYLLRAKADIIYGDGGIAEHTTVLRAQMNFIEYIPLALILMAMLEFNGAGAGLLHGLGITLVAARIVHPFGLHLSRSRMPGHFFGAGVTWLMIIVACAAGLLRFLSQTPV